MLLGFWLALGAGRSAWSEVASGPRSVAMLPQHVTLELRGDVSAEPLPERKGRLLVIAVAAVSRDNGRSWLPASGRVEAFLDGPDDWFAPVYGDTLVLTGKLQAFQHGAPAGVSAQLAGARARVVARGGGSPLLASLYALRVRLATNIQHALPEPEAALLIGILLGLKTPMLRARLPLFTVTGTIHLVVPAGLKVSVLADLAYRGTGWLGRWPGTAASLLTVFMYAALGGGGPAAVRAAIMGALLVVGSALRRQYDVFTGLACAVLLMTAFDPLLIYDAGFQLTE